LLRLFSSSLSLRDFHKDPALPLASIIPIMTAFFSAPRYDLSAKAYYVPNTIGFGGIFIQNVTQRLSPVRLSCDYMAQAARTPAAFFAPLAGNAFQPTRPKGGV
jgi:hypothetical protein